MAIIKIILLTAGLLLTFLQADTYPKPTGLSSSDATYQDITLKWNKAEDAVGYYVYEVTGDPRGGYIYNLIDDISQGPLPSYVVTTLPSGSIDPDTSYRFAVTAAYNVGGDIVQSDYTSPITAATTHLWSGAMQECVNAALGNSDPGHIPTRVELESVTSFDCYNKNLTAVNQVEDLKNLMELDLDNNKLAGSIPSGIWSLTHLTDLDLSDNLFAGNIPPEIGNLTELTDLDLRDNQLSGGIPHEIGDLTHLAGLNLNDNQLTGSIPAEIGNLMELIGLNLSSNQLTGSIPEEISKLKKLTILSLHDNQLTGGIPKTIGNLKNLLYLLMYQNQLTGNIPAEIGNLKNLLTLSLSFNRLTGSTPVEIGSLSSLLLLELDHNLLTGVIPKEISNLKNTLKGLFFDHNRLTGSIPSEITHLTKLEYLYLSHNFLAGTIPAEIKNLTSLKDGYGLDLTYNCRLYSDSEEVKAFINSKSSAGSSYKKITDTNGHCPILIPVTSYLLD